MLFVGRVACGYCVCLEANCYVVANVLMCLQVGRVRTLRFGSFAGYGGAGVACLGYHSNKTYGLPVVGAVRTGFEA